jgi:hypothetical protein
MTPLELSVSDTTIWSITLELSNTILVVLFTTINDAYGKGITYDDRQLTIIVYGTGHWYFVLESVLPWTNFS